MRTTAFVLANQGLLVGGVVVAVVVRESESSRSRVRVK